MTTEPILAQIAGIDQEPRLLSAEEVAGLTDWFGQHLARTPVSERKLTLRSLLKDALPTGSYTIYAIADGIPIVYNHADPNDVLNSVDRNLRFIIIALPDKALRAIFDVKQAILDRTLCIVGSAHADGTTEFLQCASWDPKGLDKQRNLGIMRFYERTVEDGWVYVGNSLNAFTALSINQGPFDGHIGGALIMKELTSPWTHWLDTNSDDFVASLGSTKDKPSKCDPFNALNDVLFSGPNGPPFSLIRRAESLEPIVELSVTKWYESRFTTNFLDHKNKPLPEISAVRDWVGHALLNRSMNIAASATSTPQVEQKSNIDGVPTTLFFNSNALQRLLPDAGPDDAYTIANEVYVEAIEALEFSLYYPEKKTGRPLLAVKGSEGPFAFPVIEPGVEDYQGIRTMVNKASIATILPPKAIAAMLMVDFFNPIYSARREGLMKYVPEKAKLKADGKTYDVLDQFTANVSASPAAKDPASAEHEILQLLATPDSTYVNDFTQRINTYLGKVTQRLTSEGILKVGAVQEYMALADGRRRMYRGRENEKPTGGLNEFMLTLPMSPKVLPLTKMMEDATVTVMAAEEIAYFSKKNEMRKHAMEKMYAHSASGIQGCPVLRSIRNQPLQVDGDVC